MDYLYPPPPALAPGSLVIAYARDSGGQNQQESIGQQTRVITDYCQTHGLILARIYSDTASGRRTKNRSQFLEMCNSMTTSAESQLPRGLLLWAFSRFSRDIVDFNYYLYGLMRRGLIIHSLTEQIPDGLTGQLMLSIKAFTNADFSIQLGKQIKRGIADRVKAGYNNGGQAPKGYNVIREVKGSRRNGMPRVGVKWEPDPELAPLVRLAWELRAQGASYAEITKATHGKVYTSKNSWVTHFRNESYIGVGKAGEMRIQDHHPPLINWEAWEAVRRIESDNCQRHNHRRLNFPALLTGLAHCIHCGASMVIHSSDGYKSYACGKHDRKKGYADCPNSRRISARKAETAILETVFNRILSAEFAASILEDIQRQMDDNKDIDREIDELTNALIQAEKSIKNLVKLAEDTGGIEEVKSRLIEVKQKESEYESRIKALKAEKEKSAPKITPEALALVFETWRDEIRTATQSGDIVTAKKLLSQFIQNIELGREKTIITYTYPLSNPARIDGILCAHNITA